MNPVVRFSVPMLAATALLGAEAPSPHFRVDVNMVELSVVVKDYHGDYVRGLKAGDFRILEDSVPQVIRGFAEGAAPSPFSGSVFVLFDTSDCMYEGFTHAEDAIDGFIRGLSPSTGVAVYSFSRNVFRAASLTHDRLEAISGLRRAVAGDDTALYNALLITIRDAAKVPGRKSIVVFSNGPDNASLIGPDDVLRIAQDEGVSIYLVSTKNENQRTRKVFEALTTATGGRAYYARTWKRQAEALDRIGSELASSYTLAYYPEPGARPGFRKIDVQVARDGHYKIRTRSGYRPRTAPESPWPPVRVVASGSQSPNPEP